MFLGPPGFDEPALKPFSDVFGGSEGVPQRMAVKDKKREQATAKQSTQKRARMNNEGRGSSAQEGGLSTPALSCGTAAA